MNQTNRKITRIGYEKEHTKGTAQAVNLARVWNAML